MTVVKFYDSVDDSLLKFAVIVSRGGGKWVFCKHRERNTYECPGGHREKGEDIFDTARRELYEETGAVDFDIEPVCVYSVTAPDNFNGEETFGMLYLAEIRAFEKELHSEIEKIMLTDNPPSNWTYPEIQPKLLAKVIEKLNGKKVRIYQKLVRDNIPEIIKKSGETPVTSTLDDNRYETELRKKLVEEVNEFLEGNGDDALAELADIIEVAEALAKFLESSLEKVMEIKEQKAGKNGRFEKKLFLERVEEN